MQSFLAAVGAAVLVGMAAGDARWGWAVFLALLSLAGIAGEAAQKVAEGRK